MLATIVLLGFLVLVVVGLLATTRVETQVAATHSRQSQARANALMALNIAIGQLQKHAGPDARVTAQAGLADAAAENPWFTGVWDVGAGSGASTLPAAWLVSGNEVGPTTITPATLLHRAEEEVPLRLVNGLAANGPDAADRNTVRLVGPGTADTGGAGLANGAVAVPGVPINVLVHDLGVARTVGRYAFWVGDQGVKASLALPDKTADVNYAPWLTADAAGVVTGDQRDRIRQQLGTAPTFFSNTAAAREGFDPLADENVFVRRRILREAQLRFLAPVPGAASLDEYLKLHYHEAAASTFSVLANTLPDANLRRGLMADLSLQPSLLGPAFAARANYEAYMEAPSFSNTAVPPITSATSARRRYNVIAPLSVAQGDEFPAMQFGVAPVLASFLVQFKVARVGGNAQVMSRMFAELWNPYTSAFVPPAGLSLEISGLPSIVVGDPVSRASTFVDLQKVNTTLAGEGSPAPMRVNLPFAATAQNDRASWLPGRVYAWVTETGANPSADLNFYNKNMSVAGWAYTPLALAGSSPNLTVEAGDLPALTIKLKRGAEVLAVYTSPAFPAFAIADVANPPLDLNWKFGYGFRLRQPSSLNKDRGWLVTPGADFRAAAPPAAIFTAFNETRGLNPAAYYRIPDTTDGLENFLLFRKAGAALTTTRSANLDAPLFELPRLPHLSLGELQHMQFPEGRPFALGNPWGADVKNAKGETINGWFDRFFFSGLPVKASTLPGEPDLGAGQPLPNVHLRLADGAKASTLREAAGGLSSRHLLQAGGFNLHSTSAAAWQAVLSGVRFSAARPFARAVIEDGTLTTNYTGGETAVADFARELLADTTLDSTGAGGGPAFFRFPQSAQETYFWSASAKVASESGAFSRQYFRQGVRGGSDAIAGRTAHTLITAQVAAMSCEIVALVRQKFAAGGPFRSIEDFLAPQAVFGGASLLEKTIADCGINPAGVTATDTVPGFTDPGFSSLTLTQADIMTALAPFLRARSDTFVVRAYGEALNPATQAVAGRAWCEATVQRFPETVSPGDTIAAPAVGGFGRRFKVISFRWLSADDI